MTRSSREASSVPPPTPAPPPAAEPPVAPRREHVRDLHGERVPDPYAWMRRTDDPALHDYLAAENAFTAAATSHLARLRATLVAEMAATLPDEDVSAPWRSGGWDYRTRRPAGSQHEVLVRRRAGSDEPEQVLLDENLLAEGHDYLALGVCEVSPDGRLLAYSTDVDGSETYTLHVRDLTTGEDLPDAVPGTYYGLAWTADSGSVVYTTLDDAYRPESVRRHVVGTDAAEDTLVLHEPDRRFELTVEATRSGAYVRLVAASRDTTEVHLLDTRHPERPAVLVEPRVTGREYRVEHEPGPDGGRLLVVTDDTGPQFRLVEAPVATPGRAHWREVLGHRDDTRLVAADAVGGHVVVTERNDFVLRLRVLDGEGRTVRLVEPERTGESVRLGRVEEQDVTSVRVVREGWLRTPADVEHDLATGAETVVHQRQVLAGPWRECTVEVVKARADDGVEVPVTVVTRRGTPQPAPCLLWGYGSYESAEDPAFLPEIGPLLDRGVRFAVAHVRGGGEGGRTWWEQGRLLRKRTTFTDFVACARHLVDAGLAESSTLVARGLSAGGLLMGVTTDLAPELFSLVVAEVPFVDVVTTMLDDTLPLTVGEWDEWGDPRDPEHYAYLRGYSPYENRPGPRRPALLVTASRNDPRVSVHEPAKWVAAMRADDAALPDADRPAGPLLLHTLLGGGAHTGPAGRYDAWEHEALVQAMVLDRVGATQHLD